MKKPREHFAPLSLSPSGTKGLAEYQRGMKQIEEETEQHSKKSHAAMYLAEIDAMLTAKNRSISDLSSRGQSVEALKAEQAGIQQVPSCTRSVGPSKTGPGAGAERFGRPAWLALPPDRKQRYPTPQFKFAAKSRSPAP